MNPQREHTLQRIARVVRRIPYYFVVSLVVVGCLAGLQFLLFNHTTGWMRSASEIPKHRLIGLDVLSQRSLAVATFYSYEKATKSGLDLRLAIIRSDDLAEVALLRPTGMITAKLSPCGLFLGAIRNDGTASVFEVGRTFRQPREIAAPELTDRFRSVWWSPDSRLLLLQAIERVLIWDREKREVVHSMPVDRSTEVVVAEGRDCFCLANNGDCRVVEWDTGRVLSEFPMEPEARNIVVSRDASTLAYTWGADLRVIDTRSQRVLFQKHYSVAYAAPPAVALSADGRRLAFIQVGPDPTEHAVRVMEVSTETEIASYSMGKALVSGVKFSGDSVWAWTTRGSVSRWDLSLDASDAKHWTQRDVWGSTKDIESPTFEY